MTLINPLQTLFLLILNWWNLSLMSLKVVLCSYCSFIWRLSNEIIRVIQTIVFLFRGEQRIHVVIWLIPAVFLSLRRSISTKLTTFTLITLNIFLHFSELNMTWSNKFLDWRILRKSRFSSFASIWIFSRSLVFCSVMHEFVIYIYFLKLLLFLLNYVA